MKNPQISFSYRSPTIAYSSMANGPATGGELLLINGDDFGVYDYSPTVSIGDSGADTCAHASQRANSYTHILVCAQTATRTFLFALQDFYLGLKHIIHRTRWASGSPGLVRDSSPTMICRRRGCRRLQHVAVGVKHGNCVRHCPVYHLSRRGEQRA